LEKRATQKGVEGILLGTDDETFRTSLSQKKLSGDNLFTEIQNIKNLNHHPYEFYKSCGYTIVGVVPNANGKNKPDILMWENIIRSY
jgi:aminoglycoside 6'-N-acetyltransferase I